MCGECNEGEKKMLRVKAEKDKKYPWDLKKKDGPFSNMNQEIATMEGSSIQQKRKEIKTGEQKGEIQA